MAKNFWNTDTKRWLAMLSWLIAGWHAVTMGYSNLPSWPDFVETTFMGEISILVIAGAFCLYSIFLLMNEEI